jgi:hypothetical protein
LGHAQRNSRLPVAACQAANQFIGIVERKLDHLAIELGFHDMAIFQKPH